MNIAMILIGGLIFLSFPFIVLQKIKKTKQENTDEAKKKLNLFLICTIPVPVVAIILFLMGLKYCCADMKKYRDCMKGQFEC